MEHEFQFPLANIYNHDPIYGKEGTGIHANSMNGAQFRNYMFMQGTRGTAFWELYYSDELFNNEKYLINADFLEWAEANFSKLRNGKMIGRNPDTNSKLTSGVIANAAQQEAYGFAGFDGKAGIISVRNPAASERNITFTLDEAIGVTYPGTYYVTLVSGYTHNNEAHVPYQASYQKGDTISLNLKPGETLVWSFDQVADTTAPVLDRLYFNNRSNLQVRASERVKDVALSVKVNGGVLDSSAYTVEKLEDLRSFNIRLNAPLTSGNLVEVSATAGTDASGNALAPSQIARTYYENGIVAFESNIKAGENVIVEAAKSLNTADGFSVTATVKNAQVGAIVEQQGAYVLGIDAEKKPYFEVNGTRVTGKVALVDGFNQLIAGVKENNGLLKLYVDGQITRSAYNVANKDFVLPQADIRAMKNAAEVKDVTVYNRALGYDEVPQLQLVELINRVEESKNRFTEESYVDNQVAQHLVRAKQALADKSAQRLQKQEEAYNALYEAYLKLIPKLVRNIALNKPAEAKFTDGTVDGVTPGVGRPVSYLVDGVNPSERNAVNSAYTIVGSETAVKNSYVEIDLGELAHLNSVNLTRYWLDNRSYRDTAFVVAKNADFSDKQVLYYSAKNVGDDLFDLGVASTESLYRENTVNSAGKVLYDRANGGEKVEFRYLRLYGRGVDNGDNRSENHLVELTVMGSFVADDPYNLEALRALIERAKAEGQKDIYETAGVEALNALIPQVEAILAEVEAGTQVDKSIGYVERQYNALQEKLNALVLKPTIRTSQNDLGNGVVASSTGRYAEGLVFRAEDVSADFTNHDTVKGKDAKVYDLYLWDSVQEVRVASNQENHVKIKVDKVVDKVYYLPERAGEQVEELRFTQDPVTKEISFTTSHFSHYAFIFKVASSTNSSGSIFEHINPDYIRDVQGRQGKLGALKPAQDKDIVPNTSAKP